MLELFPETKLGIGPPIDTGFYYDFDRPTAFTPEDLEKIEKRMWEIQARDLPYERVMTPKDEGLRKVLRRLDEVELIEERAGDVFSRVHAGTALHRFLPRPARARHFEDQGVQAALHRRRLLEGRRDTTSSLQRIYGTAFFSKKDLDEYLKQLEEAKKRDHRKLGKELDLFSIQELAGPGLIFFHPKGGIIRKQLEDWMRDQYLKRGYSLVYTPHVMRARPVEDLRPLRFLRREHVHAHGAG